MVVQIAPSGQPINSTDLLNQLATGPAVGPIPTTPYAPANVQPLQMPTPVPGTPPKPVQQRQWGGGGGGGTGAGPAAWGGFPTYQQYIMHKMFGLGGSPQQGMNQMNLPPQLMQQLMMQLMNPGGLGGPGAAQGGGGMRDASGQGPPGDRL